ncbi:YqeG family HAD IIIA-type phosphatase [Streptococcus cuniculipharyngis]|uniref:YqeG family HAD IIIA-type phosphatase n=1 Tax=Streptococcus cuniculipharyngis TaxID=1562651 RepID=A0A5C5SF05_9STRE|nr:YqeG family HAD IIIA-type phosphatase [Streptococcus cuniculipharyngis]TWS98880.1 YqeG family HAD IIIA-type phosphatase [Streptococcus cuniculipharyngis]
MLKSLYPYEFLDSVFAIDYQKLRDKGYKGLIFDIDSTLVPHGRPSTPEIDALFKEIQNLGFKTLLLSNNSDERIKEFTVNIDSLYIPLADKPKTDNYLKALKLLDLPKDQVVMIGDQLFTDILGANRSGIASILVQFLMQENETKIGKKRMVEKLILASYGLQKAYQHRLGDIEKKGV